MSKATMRFLLAGWFSFDEMGATGGDLLVRDLTSEWLETAGVAYDLAHSAVFEGGVDWRTADPGDYSHVVFVCGPFGNGRPLTDFLSRFTECKLVGLNLSMVEPLETWNPFDLLIERDSSFASRPDLTLLSTRRLAPVVGVSFVPDQPEMQGAMHKIANEAIEDFLRAREVARVRIDTRLDVGNTAGLRTPSEVEALIAHMDVVITTRLHGLVLALKNGVPAIPVDPIATGHKVKRQVESLSWPILFTADSISDTRLQEAFDYCLTPEARKAARECALRAARRLQHIPGDFISWLHDEQKQLVD